MALLTGPERIGADRSIQILFLVLAHDKSTSDPRGLFRLGGDFAAGGRPVYEAARRCLSDIQEGGLVSTKQEWVEYIQALARQEPFTNSSPKETAMPDDLKKTGLDRKLISLSEPHEVRNWTESLGVTEQELSAAVAAVGNSADKVRIRFLTGGLDMKITSVNKKGTNNVHDVSFNVDGPIDRDALLSVNVDGFSVKADGQCLRVQSDGEHVVNEDTVRAVNEALETAVASKAQKDEQIAADHERMLTSVQANTGLKRE